jgi:hypothetical protein
MAPRSIKTTFNDSIPISAGRWIQTSRRSIHMADEGLPIVRLFGGNLTSNGEDADSLAALFSSAFTQL